MSLTVGQAGARLGVSGGDIERAIRCTSVSEDQVRHWPEAPPPWLVAAVRRKGRRAARADDRRLSPPAVALRLQVRCHLVAAAMRTAGVSAPLRPDVVEGWLPGTSCAHGMPGWLAQVLSEAAASASGAFTVGQHVLAFYDNRAAVVLKINRVTVKVRHVGGQADRYQLVEKNYWPTYLHPLPDQAIAVLAPITVGAVVGCADWGGWPRQARVTELEGPLLGVQYRLASGQRRNGWIDALRLDPVTTTGGLSC